METNLLQSNYRLSQQYYAQLKERFINDLNSRLNEDAKKRNEQSVAADIETALKNIQNSKEVAEQIYADLGKSLPDIVEKENSFYQEFRTEYNKGISHFNDLLKTDTFQNYINNNFNNIISKILLKNKVYKRFENYSVITNTLRTYAAQKYLALKDNGGRYTSKSEQAKLANKDKHFYAIRPYGLKGYLLEEYIAQAISGVVSEAGAKAKVTGLKGELEDITIYFDKIKQNLNKEKTRLTIEVDGEIIEITPDNFYGIQSKSGQISNNFHIAKRSKLLERILGNKNLIVEMHNAKKVQYQILESLSRPMTTINEIFGKNNILFIVQGTPYFLDTFIDSFIKSDLYLDYGRSQIDKNRYKYISQVLLSDLKYI